MGESGCWKGKTKGDAALYEAAEGKLIERSPLCIFAPPVSLKLRSHALRTGRRRPTYLDRLGPSPGEVLGDSGSILTKRYLEQAYSVFGLRQVVVLDVDVEQVDVPRQFDVVQDLGFDVLQCDSQSRVLRPIVYVAVAGIAELLVIFGEEPLAQFRGERLACLDTNLHLLHQLFPSLLRNDFAWNCRWRKSAQLVEVKAGRLLNAHLKSGGTKWSNLPR